MALCPASTGDGASSNRMGAVVRATLLSSPGGRPPRLQQQQLLLLLLHLVLEIFVEDFK